MNVALCLVSVHSASTHPNLTMLSHKPAFKEKEKEKSDMPTVSGVLIQTTCVKRKLFRNRCLMMIIHPLLLLQQVLWESMWALDVAGHHSGDQEDTMDGQNWLIFDPSKTVLIVVITTIDKSSYNSPTIPNPNPYFRNHHAKSRSNICSYCPHHGCEQDRRAALCKVSSPSRPLPRRYSTSPSGQWATRLWTT